MVQQWIHGWAFNIESFAKLYSEKFNIKEEILITKLWDENYMNYKTKEFSDEPFNKNNQPLFVELILNNIYKLCKIITEDKDKA